MGKGKESGEWLAWEWGVAAKVQMEPGTLKPQPNPVGTHPYHKHSEPESCATNFDDTLDPERILAVPPDRGSVSRSSLECQCAQGQVEALQQM